MTAISQEAQILVAILTAALGTVLLVAEAQRWLRRRRVHPATKQNTMPKETP